MLYYRIYVIDMKELEKIFYKFSAFFILLKKQRVGFFKIKIMVLI